MTGDEYGGTADEYGGALRLAAGESVERVVGGLDADPEAWLALDAGFREAFRDSSWRPGAERWRFLRNLGLRREQVYSPSALVLALCHGDGRIREKALRQAEAHPQALPLVVVRCADWAGPVRLPARDVLARMLTVERAVALTPLVLRVGRRDRGDVAVGLVRDVLRQASAAELRPLLDHPDRRPRRFGVELALLGGLFTPVELARTAAADPDVVVQDLCADAALAALPEKGAAREAVLEPLLTARNSRARSTGVTALRRAGRPDLAEAYLSDRSTVVRACARWVLREHGVDPLPRYRALCADPADSAVPPGAVLGLAECGTRQDTALLRPLLAHPVAAVRARAVAALRMLDAVDRAELTPLLDDPAPAVVRETAKALLPDARSLDTAALVGMLASGGPAHRRRWGLTLLAAQGGLPALRATADLLDDEDEKMRVQASLRLRTWEPGDRTKGDPEVAALLEHTRDHIPRSRLHFLTWATGATLAPRRDA
ncbi:hypothetical protein ABT026_27235 [Streptomyces sp. NPDC002734]|uniref:hypothetical protein n=1 Tax=Streptomyces sp. NPDC002734 TaxID=3154426 RepID=UPI00332F7549